MVWALPLPLPLSHYAKRLVRVDHELGDEDHHLERFAALCRAGPCLNATPGF